MKASERVSFVMRRGIVAGACAASRALPPLRAQQARAPGFDTFLAVSTRLTGRASFDPLLADRVHAALARNDAGFAAKIAALESMDRDARRHADRHHHRRARSHASRTGEDGRRVMRAWYLGVVGEPPHVEVVAYERALMFDPVGDMLTIPSYCRGEPADWAKKP